MAFQCYSVNEPVSTKERYEKQRDKITSDLAKFSGNCDDLSKLFGSTAIGTWVLVVPRFDSAKLVQHASNKADELRKLKLPYVATGFEVQIITDDHFEIEREQLRQDGLAQIKLPSFTVQPKDLGDWTKSHNALVDRMNNKLQRLPTVRNRQDLKRVRTQLLMHYLAGENLLDHLKQDYPYWYEKLSQCKQHRERFLATNSLLRNEPLWKTIEDYVVELREKVKAIDAENAEVLGYSTATDWLLRCPLDFPVTTNA